VKKITVYVISSVRPENSSAGQVILHRHLMDASCLEYQCYGDEPEKLTVSSVFRRIMGRLAKTKFKRFAHDFWAWRDGRWLDGLLPAFVPEPSSSLVLTVAHGDAFGAAQRFAHKHSIPLVTLFQDWWPDFVSLHAPFQGILEKRFLDLYQQSQLALCVSERMRDKLGAHSNAQVLFPISEKVGPLAFQRKADNHMKVLYFGNLCEYGPMLAEALLEMKSHPRMRLETRGANPNWPESFRCEMERERLWHDFAPFQECQTWLESADAYLITMVFDPSMRKRMETSFPSKIGEMAQKGRPLVIWGPEYCSAIQWARRGNRALCVTNPDPGRLRWELEKLASSPEEQKRLSLASLRAAQTDFSPERVQAQFLDALKGTLEMTH
jgi:glycosyltransferase involved in cell wall biosynthesis